jgi:hypothetical protein
MCAINVGFDYLEIQHNGFFFPFSTSFLKKIYHWTFVEGKVHDNNEYIEWMNIVHGLDWSYRYDYSTWIKCNHNNL